MTHSRGGLSAYVPARPHTPSVAAFPLPLQAYIIETVERQARRHKLRQAAAVTALVIGMFVFQWPVAPSVANAVPSLPVSAATAGVHTPTSATVDRLAFAASMRTAF